MKAKDRKDAANIEQEDRLYKIAAQIVELRGQIDQLEGRLSALRRGGASLMRERGWPLAIGCDLQIVYCTTRTCYDWAAMKKEIPDLIRFRKRVNIKDATIIVTRKK